MVYVVTLSARELAENLSRFRIEMRLTKAAPKEVRHAGTLSGPSIALVLSESRQVSAEKNVHRLAWTGVVARHNTVGAVDNSITIDPFRECRPESIPLDDQGGLLNELEDELRAQFESSISLGGVGAFGRSVWEALNTILRTRYPHLTDLLDWLLAQADPPVLDSNDPADRAWQEQRDATRSALKIADFPLPALAAWQRPTSRDAPYLAGLIPQPVEWRLGSDPCFLKLAYWPQEANMRPAGDLTPGMYLPISYVRLLLEDDCTRGADPGRQARILGYEQVARYLSNKQFVDMVKFGLAGTVRVTADELRKVASERAESGQSVVVAIESSSETTRQRQIRLRRQGAKARSYAHEVTRRSNAH